MSSAAGIGEVALVQPGVEVWTKNDPPRGGIVIAVTEDLDETTGELARVFRCIDHTRTHGHIRWSTLTEDQIDRQTAQSVDISVLVRLWRTLADHVGFIQGGQHKPRKGPATAEEARLVDAMRILVGLVFGSDGPLYGMLRRKTESAPEARDPVPANIQALIQ